MFTAAQLAPGEGIEDAVGRLAALVEAQQHARIAELEAQLEAIGAGGVSGPLVGQPQAMPDLSALTESGALDLADWLEAVGGGPRAKRCAALLREQHARIAEQLQAQRPSSGFTAADMATAESRGFRDGVASVAANAPAPSAHIKEPYTLAEIKNKIASNDYSAELLLQHAMLLLDSASLSANAGEPVAWWIPKAEQFCIADKSGDRPFAKAWEPLYAAPPTAQAEGWTKASKQLPPCREDQLYIGINTAGFAGVFNAVRVVNGNTYCLMEVAEESVSIMSDLAIWKPFNPPTSAEGVGS